MKYILRILTIAVILSTAALPAAYAGESKAENIKENVKDTAGAFWLKVKEGAKDAGQQIRDTSKEETQKAKEKIQGDAEAAKEKIEAEKGGK